MFRNSDNNAVAAFEFCDVVNRLKTASEIERVTLDALSQFGLHHATCAIVPPPGQSPSQGIIMNNRPAEYLRRYAEENYAQKDPVILELNHATRPFSWGDVKAKRKLTREQLAIVDEATEFEATDGLIIPIYTPTGLSIFAPCGRKPNLSPRARSAVEIIGITAHQALLRAKQVNYRVASTVRLTSRECEVLKWITNGKTDDEIGMILSISKNTVGGYVENAKRKLNAGNRTAAVIEAMRRGELNL
jgi:LuxR family transcriptional regulator, quorum-sensing system regulator BjaR1